ncbi:MAG: IS110 family transposase [Chloroflexota bacterium]
MQQTYYVGIDIASATFVASVIKSPVNIITKPKSFANETTGFEAFETWLSQLGVTPTQAILCMEATGVYGEGLAYHLSAHEWWVAVAPPLQVKQAFAPIGHKTDAVDARQIAEYAFRFQDQLHRFVPKQEIIEQVKVLLQLREQFVRQKTAQLNSQQALKRKPIRTPLAEALLDQNISHLKTNIDAIEKEIKQLFNQDSDFGHQIALLLTIPGVGLLLASHIVVLSSNLRDPLNHKTMAAYLGISPYQHSSGSSVRRQATSRHFGPATVRKLLHLAARSRRTHHPASRRYFERKVAAGKPKSVVLNNMANRLVRVICAVLRSRQPFIKDFVSLPPQVFSSP